MKIMKYVKTLKQIIDRTIEIWRLIK